MAHIIPLTEEKEKEILNSPCFVKVEDINSAELTGVQFDVDINDLLEKINHAKELGSDYVRMQWSKQYGFTFYGIKKH